MDNDQQMLKRDLTILEQMSVEMDAYLISESTRWTMARGDMPRLTIGGCLMRRHRLPVLRDQLEMEGQKRLDIVVERVDQMFAENIVRFETRAHQELHARMSEWIGHLRSWAELVAVGESEYANMADTRMVITAMIDKLESPPYQLDGQILTELTAIDGRLRSCWLDGDFIWPALWQPAYPQPRYWWLYGKPGFGASKENVFGRIVIPEFSSPVR